MANAYDLKRLPVLPLVGLGVVLLAVLAAISLSFAQATQSRWAAHALQVEVAIGAVRERVVTAESAYRGYMIRNNPTMLEDLARAEADVQRELANLRRLTADNPRQQQDLARLVPLIREKLDLGRGRIATVLAGHRDAVLAGLLTNGRGQGRQLMDEIRDLTHAMADQEQARLREREARARLLTGLIAAFLAMGAAVALFSGLLTAHDARRRYLAMREARDQARAAERDARDEAARREAAEAQLRQVQKMETIGQLSGGIAHDFNNMMAIVLGSIDIAERRLDQPDRVRRCLADARIGAERAAALTARLLAFSRRQPLAPEPIEGNALVGGMSDLLQRVLGERITVETELARDLWPSFADPGQLENALVNLAVNARDAMLTDGVAGNGTLTIATSNIPREIAEADPQLAARDYVLFSVQDTGQGMDAATQERAFDPFFTTKEVGKGTGLGLSQVFGFAKQSGGHVELASWPGQGTTVRFYLPRFEGEVASLPEAHGDDPVPNGRADEVILVVEDEQHVRHFSVEALRELGYTAVGAASGPEALKLLAEGRGVDVLFTDIVMPEMNGRQLKESALAARPGLKVLYTSGYARDLVDEDANDPVDILAKPFTVAELGWKMRSVIDARSRAA